MATRRPGDKVEASRLLDEAAVKADKALWMYHIVRYLLGEMDGEALLKSAEDRSGRATAHCFLGLDLAQQGKRDSAASHFQWLVDNGHRTSPEYALASAGLKQP